MDEETGASTATYLKENPWAHINFDRFRFHDAKPFFPNELTAADITLMPPMDPMSMPDCLRLEAAKAMTLPKGFTVKLAAAEPDVVRPIAFTNDDRGRLWVAEAHTYPVRAPEGKGKDRILIFEDTNGDGTLDSRKVFIEGLNLVSGIELGFGGVFVGAAPNLLFIPIKDGNDLPGRPAAGAARRLGVSGHARDAQHLLVGPRRLALWHARRLHALERRQARRAGRRAPAAERRDLALSPDRARPSRSSPRAPAIRGASTSTTTATRSRPPA